MFYRNDNDDGDNDDDDDDDESLLVTVSKAGFISRGDYRTTSSSLSLSCNDIVQDDHNFTARYDIFSTGL